jgi:hypothetical protein
MHEVQEEGEGRGGRVQRCNVEETAPCDVARGEALVGDDAGRKRSAKAPEQLRRRGGGRREEGEG